MHLNDYQIDAEATAIYPLKYSIIYPALKLSGEAGEVAEKVGKVLRDNGGEFDDDALREALKKELGDVLWYVANLAGDLGFTLEDVARTNLAKLSDRAARGVLQGSGDDR